MVQKFLMAFMAALLSVGSAQAAKNLKKTGYNLCPDVSIKKGQWTGVYAGSWVSNGGAVTLPHALVVTRVRKSGQADVLYAVGRAKKWNIRPQCLRVTGQFTDDDTLKIDFGNGVRAIYDFFDDFVNGQYISSGGTTRGQVKKVK